MASLIANCLARLVKEGRVTPKQAQQAQALHDGMQARLGDQMGTASADAVAALEAARVMAEQARLVKVSAGKQAIAEATADARAEAHPNGYLAGVYANLARDKFETGTGGKGATNVDALSGVIFGKVDGMFGPANEALGSKFAGLVQDKALAEKLIRENFGEDTRNDEAKQFSKAWSGVADYLANRAKAAGKIFRINEDWRQPQWWTSTRVKTVGGQGGATFKADILDAVRTGGLEVFDKETGAPATALKLPLILDGAYRDIVVGGGKGGGSMAFSPEMRVFRFADGKPGADAYLKLMGKYGPGQDLYAMLHEHMLGASREIALMEKLGPNYGATIQQMVTKASTLEKLGTAKPIVGRFKSFPALNSIHGVQKLADTLTGKGNQVAAGLWGSIFAHTMTEARGWLSAVQLPSAILSSMPGDAAATALSARYNGIPAARAVARVFKATFADKESDRAFAARLGVIASGGSDTALTQARYADQFLGPGFGGKAASTTIRATWLQAWTEAAKRVSQMELLGLIGDNAAKAYDAVIPPFRRFLDRYGVTPDEWETLRAAPLVEHEGAKFFDPQAAVDQRLGDKLMSAVIDESRFFLMAPGAEERAILTPSAMKGTLAGEVARSMTMYKSFAVTVVTTHMMRAAMQKAVVGGLNSKVGYLTALAGLTTMFGAIAIGAKDIRDGKDPRRMNTPGFWIQAALQGGGLGIFGDFVNAGVNRASTASFAATMGGPLAAAIDNGSQLLVPPIRQLIQGKQETFGATLARTMRSYLLPEPFYAKLVIDRLLWDEVQTLLDPNYRQSFAAQEKRAQDTGAQKFWWAPGTTSPQRAPNLGNAVQ